MRQALRQGATLVGGVDPARIDNDIEASLHTMDLAVEADAGIDLHLHDPGPLGIFTIERLAAMVEDAGWQGRVTLSHAYCSGDVSNAEAVRIADKLAALDIELISSVPIGSSMPPVDLMQTHGVRVALGSDNILTCGGHSATVMSWQGPTAWLNASPGGMNIDCPVRSVMSLAGRCRSMPRATASGHRSVTTRPSSCCRGVASRGCRPTGTPPCRLPSGQPATWCIIGFCTSHWHTASFQRQEPEIRDNFHDFASSCRWFSVFQYWWDLIYTRLFFQCKKQSIMITNG